MSTVHVVALGGSLLRPEEASARTMWMGQLRQLMVHLEGNGRRIGLVVGGGLPAREGIGLAREIIHDSEKLDRIGIAGTRLNATVLQQLLLDIGCDVAPAVPHTIEAARLLLEDPRGRGRERARREDAHHGRLLMREGTRRRDFLF